MVSFDFAALFALLIHGASAVSQTFFQNSTATSLSAPTATKGLEARCSNNCRYPAVDLSYIAWFQLAITATYTVETVVLVVNQRANSTRTTTFSNTAINFSTIAEPSNVNSAGTVTTSVVNDDGSTRFVAYPTTVLIDYAPNISWTGTLSTTVSGTPTCSIAPTGAVEIFPSHPSFPEGVQAFGVNTIEDPRGLTYVAVIQEAYADNGSTIEDLFPGLGVWNCRPPFFLPLVVQGPAILETALYLTTTSTSTELDHAATLVEAPASRTPPILEPASKTFVITPSPALATTFPTTPVAIPVPVTSTDSEGKITIDTSTAIVHPIIISSTNAQGSVVTATSLSTDSVSASLPTIITSTDAQGVVLTSTTHLPAIILTTINAAGSKIVTTSALSAFTPPASASTPIIINGETISPNAQLQYIISGQTISPGGSSITLGSGTSAKVLALQTSSGSTALIYGPSTSLLPSAADTAAAALTIGTETITPNAQSQYLISGSTLAIGSTITLTSGSSTTVLALQTSGSQTALVYAPRTSFLTPIPTTPPAITIGSETITANSQTQYIIGSQTLTPGGVVTVSGTEVSLAAGESDVVVGTSTEPLAPYITAGTPPAITIGSEMITANSQTQYIIGSQTLTPGGVVTVSGTEVSLAAGESDVVVGTSTEPLAPYITAGTPPAITIGSETITANSQTQYIIGSQTLTPGGVVTVSGTEVSLAAGESDVVVGTSTESLAPYITAGFGSGVNGNAPQIFAGGAEGGFGWGWRGIWLVVVGVGIVVCF